MHHHRRISEAYMVAAFLRTEASSVRITPTIQELLQRDGRNLAVVTDPDLTNAAENCYRRELLGVYRGFGCDQALFSGFPPQVRWYRALADTAELARVRYINYDYWVELSGGSRLPVDAAVRIRQGSEVFGVSNAGFWHLSDALTRGAVVPELIMVGAKPHAPLVLLEGHARLTAYFLRPATLPNPLPVIVGYARDIAAWGLY